LCTLLTELTITHSKEFPVGSKKFSLEKYLPRKDFRSIIIDNGDYNQAVRELGL
jgi:hypothetical protein